MPLPTEVKVTQFNKVRIRNLGVAEQEEFLSADEQYTAYLCGEDFPVVVKMQLKDGNHSPLIYLGLVHRYANVANEWKITLSNGIALEVDTTSLEETPDLTYMALLNFCLDQLSDGKLTVDENIELGALTDEIQTSPVLGKTTKYMLLSPLKVDNDFADFAK